MISEDMARRLLLSNKYMVNMQSPYRNLTILDAKYDEVKSFLVENDYMGDIIVYGKNKDKNAKKAGQNDGVERLPTEGEKIDSGVDHPNNNSRDREIYQQMELQF